MADLEYQLHEDRVLRDAAKRLVKADIAFVKGDMSQKGLGGRMADRAKDGAADIAENAAEYADTHRTEVGTGLAVGILALIAWIFRDRLADAVYAMFHDKSALEEAADRAAEMAEHITDDARSFLNRNT
ncbi:hypothetical protein [Aurantiacibacter poecillastricola]|uniref:hypothetical protein n=1 Tax=Aurantiacibacter poecillastricola TaxID=3064385 RepID=UPI00273D6409|nr:hypothetical protein [Aurantiacibacter sp. 219JJ12-13]MDP5261953.1 hypothetical protein [Aurantiacibacter sp. 219JJ12-13]